MKIAMVASEVAPFSKTGGLGDVIGALPPELSRLGESVVVISPLYSMVRENAGERGPELMECPVAPLRVPVGDFEVEARLFESRLPGSEVKAYFLENDHYYDRPGLYTNPEDGGDYQDNSERFIFLCRGALEACKALGMEPDVFHCHDWQTGLLPIYLRYLYKEDLPGTASVFTIHNLAYQGLFWHWDMKLAGLPWELFNWRMLEYYGNLSFLKGGLVGAHVLTTVSQRYAEEIQTEEYGMGMEGVLRQRSNDLFGVVNGVDYNVWNPATDKLIVRNYSPEDQSGKQECKRALQEAFKLPVDDHAPLVGMIGRLADQKGFDLVAEALDELMERDLQLVILGTGQPSYHDLLADMASRFPDRIGVFLGFDDAVAHQIEAGSDMFLMPSRFEPCGLNQLYSLKYGTVPIVRETGGLADTVTDYNEETEKAATATGFSFKGDGKDVLVAAVDRALTVYRSNPETWQKLLSRGMQQDWSWVRSARTYRELYRKAVQEV